jgi:hypothetical protein
MSGFSAMTGYIIDFFPNLHNKITWLGSKPEKGGLKAGQSFAMYI